MSYKHKFFYNRIVLWKFLAPLCEGVDLNRTLRLPVLWWSDGEKDYKFANMRDFILSLNKTFGTSFDEKLSRNVAQKFTLFYKKEAVETKPIIEETLPTTPLISLETELVEDSLEVDWGKVDSFPNTKEGKDSLEAYAVPFGIDLKKNKSLKNMISDFKEFVSK